MDFTQSPLQLMGERDSYETKSLIIATGASAKRLLGLGEKDF